MTELSQEITMLILSARLILTLLRVAGKAREANLLADIRILKIPERLK